jgi:hypothetical protein
MKLVSSNDAETVRTTVQEAVRLWQNKSDASAAVEVLTRLRGIGPATASLLLAVHDPKRVVFFADEAFYWLCCNGSKDQIKYTAKEYATLLDRARAVTQRLGVDAVAVEKVAFVILRQQETSDTSSATKVVKTSIKPAKKEPAKRKVTMDEASSTTWLRRSKRGKSG